MCWREVFRRKATRVRITAQLIDAIKGHHLWAERYDREIKDLFALQDEMTVKLWTALQCPAGVGRVCSSLAARGTILRPGLKSNYKHTMFSAAYKEKQR